MNVLIIPHHKHINTSSHNNYELDLAKAYDKMEWSFIMECLEILKFPQQISNLIHACMASSALSINCQGRPSHKFYPSCGGLRQGDPLSPLLIFVVVFERLSHCIQDAVNDGSWCPLKFRRGGPAISHLLFADDILLVHSRGIFIQCSNDLWYSWCVWC